MRQFSLGGYGNEYNPQQSPIGAGNTTVEAMRKNPALTKADNSLGNYFGWGGGSKQVLDKSKLSTDQLSLLEASGEGEGGFGSLGEYGGALSSGASIVSSIMGAYGALKQAGQAEKGLNFAVDSYNQDTGFKIADYNRRIVDKQNARINSSQAGNYGTLADFKDANLLKAKQISV